MRIAQIAPLYEFVMAKNYELAYAEIQTMRGDLDMPEQFEGVNGVRLELESGILAQGTSPRGQAHEGIAKSRQGSF